MIDLKIDNPSRVIEHFGSLGPKARRILLSVIGDLVEQVASTAEGKIHSRSGDLAGHIKKSVKAYEHRVVGRIWNDSPHAMAIEFGAHGTRQVKGHNRQISIVFGRMIAPVESFVGAYDRHQDIAAQPFMRPAIGAEQSNIESTIQSAMEGLDD